MRTGLMIIIQNQNIQKLNRNIKKNLKTKRGRDIEDKAKLTAPYCITPIN